jgi:hypothetical protein
VGSSVKSVALRHGYQDSATFEIVALRAAARRRHRGEQEGNHYHRAEYRAAVTAENCYCLGGGSAE